MQFNGQMNVQWTSDPYVSVPAYTGDTEQWVEFPLPTLSDTTQPANQQHGDPYKSYICWGVKRAYVFGLSRPENISDKNKICYKKHQASHNKPARKRYFFQLKEQLASIRI